MERIKTGDQVQVISGNETGARGEVKQVKFGWKIGRFNTSKTRNPDGDRVIVAGINLKKKHQKPISQTRTQTGIIEREAPVHISNVMLVCPGCNEAVRVKYSLEGDKKVRVCKRCGAAIDK